MKYKRLKSFLAHKEFNTSDNTPCGISGYYFRLPHGCGIKVYANNTGKTPSDVVASHYWWVAARAMHVMNQARTKGIGAPKAHCLLPVKVDGEWAVGLVMDHIDGKHKNISSKKWGQLRRKLDRHGIQHDDMGSHNWKVQESGRIVLIDWDWTYIRKGKR